MADNNEDDIAGLRNIMSSYPKSSRGVYCAVVNHLPKLSKTAVEQILAEHEGYAASAAQSTYKKAQEIANGRLAMWAAAGLLMQGCTTDEGGLGNLMTALSDNAF